MKHSTKLMNLIFSESTSDDLKDSVFSKIDEALNKGFSSYYDGELNLCFTGVGDEVVVEDKNNDDEATVATPKGDEVELTPLTDDKSNKSKCDGSTEKVGISDSSDDDDDATPNKGYSVVVNGFDSPEQAQNYLNNMNSQFEQNATFSEVDALRLEDGSNAIFSAIDELDHNSSFSEFEEAGEALVALFSELDYADECGADTSVLRYYAEKAAEDLSDKEDAAKIKSEAEDEAAETIQDQANKVCSDVNEFFSDPDMDTAVALNEDCVSLFSDCEELTHLSGIDTSELQDTLRIYSEALTEYYESQCLFSDEDGEAVADAANDMVESGEKLKEDPDPELAKKVKVLSDEVGTVADQAEEAGVDSTALKEAAAHYSEVADEILGAYSVSRDENAMYSEDGSEVFANGETRSFSNPCLDSKIY